MTANSAARCGSGDAAGGPPAAGTMAGAAASERGVGVGMVVTLPLVCRALVGWMARLTRLRSLSTRAVSRPSFEATARSNRDTSLSSTAQPHNTHAAAHTHT